MAYLFFWNEPDLDPGCLSQFWPAPFTVDGVAYPTAEHWMMAAKARLFGDTDALAAILATTAPHEAKALGRRVRGFETGRWDATRYDVVVAGNVAKFSAHDDLRRYLLGTGDDVLVEASPYDRIWGIGLAADDPRAATPERWRGRNLLGLALMDVRTCLAAPRSPAPTDRPDGA